MNLPESIEKFIDESPVSLVASQGGPMPLAEIEKFYEKEIASKAVNKKFARLCLAGLMFAQDYIWEGHEIVQDYPELEASWWHAYMHRMEGDYGNSAYWYRRVGDSETVSGFFSLVQDLDLDDRVSSIQKRRSWDPCEFNGFISKYKQSHEESLRKVHRLEFKFLFSICLKKALN